MSRSEPEAPLEIIQLVRSAGPQGGTSGVAFALHEAFDRLGVRNRLVTLEELAPGLATRLRRLPDKLALLAEVVCFTAAASLWIARHRSDAVIINHGDAVGGEVFVNHGLHRAMVRRRPSMLLRNPLHPFIFAREGWRHAAGAYAVAVCLSTGGAQELRRLHPASRRAWVEVISNGVDPARFFPRDGYADAMPEPAFELIFVGHELERKGLRHIILALPHLPADVRLTVVGGADRAVERARSMAGDAGVGDRVAFLGRRSDVAGLIRGADLLLLPSRNEAWPLVVLEAMASGVPVLLGPVVAAPDMLGDGLGEVVVGTDGAAIAGAISALLDAPERYLRLRQEAVEKAHRYGWSEIARRYINLCLEVRRARRRGAGRLADPQ